MHQVAVHPRPPLRLVHAATASRDGRRRRHLRRGDLAQVSLQLGIDGVNDGIAVVHLLAVDHCKVEYWGAGRAVRQRSNGYTTSQRLRDAAGLLLGIMLISMPPSAARAFTWLAVWMPDTGWSTLSGVHDAHVTHAGAAIAMGALATGPDAYQPSTLTYELTCDGHLPVALAP